MKIVGVVNGYQEAEDIEEIVKVFVIKQRFSSLLSNKVNESLDSNTIISVLHNVKYFEKPEVKNINYKVDDDSKPIFNVRGIN